MRILESLFPEVLESVDWGIFHWISESFLRILWFRIILIQHSDFLFLNRLVMISHFWIQNRFFTALRATFWNVHNSKMRSILTVCIRCLIHIWVSAYGDSVAWLGTNFTWSFKKRNKNVYLLTLFSLYQHLVLESSQLKGEGIVTETSTTAMLKPGRLKLQNEAQKSRSKTTKIERNMLKKPPNQDSNKTRKLPFPRRKIQIVNTSHQEKSYSVTDDSLLKSWSVSRDRKQIWKGISKIVTKVFKTHSEF